MPAKAHTVLKKKMFGDPPEQNYLKSLDYHKTTSIKNLGLLNVPHKVNLEDIVLFYEYIHCDLYFFRGAILS